MAGAPDGIRQLVAKFRANANVYRNPHYYETEARTQLIDPLFEALGWDVRDRDGRGEVRQELRLRVPHEKLATAPDYSFQPDGRLRFFVEAKKPIVDLKNNPRPAYQLRRYGWTAKLPVSVLTDFDEFVVYDTRVRPYETDRTETAQLYYWSHEEYPDVWDKLEALFHRDAVLAGSLERLVETEGDRRHVTPVDAEFLKQLNDWRAVLASGLAAHNPDLNQRDLNFAVQQTLDRILFLRIAEDRGIEPFEQLRSVAVGGGIYPRLMALFRRADSLYNSGLFHFGAEKGRGAPDAITPALRLDDDTLGRVLEGLYEPASPYEFAVFPADVLGQVYEQFLGQVITLTDHRVVVVEAKPEVRKAGGVFYTPTYIVDYIVRQTLGRLLDGHKADPTGPVSRLRCLDPACGSGSFLLGAYQYLLDWHLASYVKDADRWAKGRRRTLDRRADNHYALTLAERKRILLDNLYGVDIDSQAVEVTKLSLLLKLLEGSSPGQLQLFAERILPDLDANIKCGNSLIRPGYHTRLQPSLLGHDDLLRVNAFDWAAEFPDIMRAGGFDAVIGNPPYIRIQALKEWAPLEVELYKDLYRAAAKGNYDIYVVFVEKALSLLNDRGRLGFILPHKFFNAQYGEPLRRLIADGRHLSHIVHFGAEQVFSSATTYTCLLFLTRAANEQFEFVKAHDLEAWQRGEAAPSGSIPSAGVGEQEWNFTIGEGIGLLAKLRALPQTLGDVATIFVGLQTSADRVFTLREKGELEVELLKPLLKTDSLKPYDFPAVNNWILFPYDVENGAATLIPATRLKRKYPNTWAYLKSHEALLRGRDNGQWNHDQWYAYGRSQNLAQMDNPKLIVQVMALKPTVIYDDRSLYMTGGGSGPFYGVRLKEQTHDLLYLLGILNSKLFGFIVASQSTVMRGGYVKYSKQYIESAPIRPIDFTNPADVACHDQLVALVGRMLDLHRRAAAERNPQVTTILQRQIEATDTEINALVYQLYGLTDQEIAVVEG